MEDNQRYQCYIDCDQEASQNVPEQPTNECYRVTQESTPVRQIIKQWPFVSLFKHKGVPENASHFWIRIIQDILSLEIQFIHFWKAEICSYLTG